MLSTTLVMTRRSTVGTATLCAKAERPPVRIAPPSANTPPVTAPSLRNWRRFMGASSQRRSLIINRAPGAAGRHDQLAAHRPRLVRREERRDVPDLRRVHHA